MSVVRSDPVVVHPARAPHCGDYFFLSNLDQNVAVIMKSVHLFNPAPARRRADEPASVIRDALAEVLVVYFPFAGTLTVSAEGKLIVRNDNAGVPFVEAVADADLASLGDISAAGVLDQSRLAGLVYVPPEAEGTTILEKPLLTVQVTRFKCGGFVLGLAMNHCLADGLSCAEFMRSWAEAARGAAMSVPPFMDRTVQRSRRPPVVLFPHREFADIADVSGLAALYAAEPTVYRSLTFTEEKIDRLRDMAAAGRRCSRFAAVTAFVWRARAAALRMRPEQETKLLIAVDSRDRVRPPLPPGFFGNAVVLPCCLCSAGELVGSPLGASVKMIEEAIAGTDDAFVRSAVDYFEVKRARPASLTATALVTSWRRLGIGKADFGWGEAAQSGSAELPEKEVVVLQSGGEGRSMLVLMGLPAPAMEKLEEMVDRV